MPSPVPDTAVKVALLADPLLGGLVGLVLRHLAAECRTVSGEAELRALVATWSPDALVADLDRYPDAPAWPAVRADGAVRVPVLGLMRRRDAEAKLRAFERGASDLIEVPFTPDEIVVRTLATIRRNSGRTPLIQRLVRVGVFEMDLNGATVRVNGTTLRLTLLEQTLLYLFLAHPGETLTREDILANIWGEQSGVTSNVIDRHIRDLRVKLQERWQEPQFIETIAGQGYRYVGDPAPTI